MIDNDILNDNSYWLVINYKYERDKIIIKRNWNNNLPIVGIFEKKNSINLWISIILNFFNNKIPRHQSFPKLIEFLDICPKNCSQIPCSSPCFPSACNFEKPVHFANSCSRLRAGYEDFIAIFLPIQRLWGKGGPWMYRIDRGHVARAHHVRSYAHEKLATNSGAKGIGSIKSQTFFSFSLKFLSSASRDWSIRF